MAADVALLTWYPNDICVSRIVYVGQEGDMQGEKASILFGTLSPFCKRQYNTDHKEEAAIGLTCQ